MLTYLSLRKVSPLVQCFMTNVLAPPLQPGRHRPVDCRVATPFRQEVGLKPAMPSTQQLVTHLQGCSNGSLLVGKCHPLHCHHLCN